MKARIRAKKKKNQFYYYIVTSVRSGPNKQPREVILEYIGPLDKLMERALQEYLNRTEPPDSSSPENLPKKWGFKCYNHGAVMALIWTAELLEIEKIMDECFSKKTIKEFSRSRILLLEMIRRADDPGSMSDFPDWIKKTSLPYYLDVNLHKLTPQDIWEAMDDIDDEQIKKANDMLIKRIKELFPNEFDRLHLDYTNYFTWISSRNNRCTICFRGHNKQKRDDLRQFSLAVITCPELQIPLHWHLYEGNKNDKSEFPDFVKQVEEFIHQIGKRPEDVTVTFDGGSNSEENLTSLLFNFICAHSLKGALKSYFDIDLDEYTEVTLENGTTRLAYRIENLEFSGIKGTGILTFSEELKQGEVAELEKKQEKFKTAFDSVCERINNPMASLQKKLKNDQKKTERLQQEVEQYNEEVRKQKAEMEAQGKKTKGRKKVEKDVPEWDSIAAMQHIVEEECFASKTDLANFINIQIELDAGKFKASYHLDDEKRDAFIRKYYGKKLTVTNHHDWSTKDILSVYVDQECIERLFRASKDPDHFAVRPQYHWTDDKIKVHVYECMSSLSLAEVLCLLLKAKGYSFSKEQLMEKLSTIRDGWVFYDKKNLQRVLEDMDESTQNLWNTILSVFKKDIRPPD